MRAADVHPHQNVRQSARHDRSRARSNRRRSKRWCRPDCADVDTMAAAERDDIGDERRLRTAPDRADGDGDIAAHPERVGEELRDTLLRHDQGHHLGYGDAGLESDACANERVERRPAPPAAVGIADDDDRAPSRPADDDPAFVNSGAIITALARPTF